MELLPVKNVSQSCTLILYDAAFGSSLANHLLHTATLDPVLTWSLVYAMKDRHHTLLLHQLTGS